MCALFKISKANKKSKFIDSSGTDIPQLNQGFVPNQYDNQYNNQYNNQNDNSTFVYDSIPKQNDNQSMMNAYQGNGNQGYQDYNNGNYNNYVDGNNQSSVDYSGYNSNNQDNMNQASIDSLDNVPYQNNDMGNNDMMVPKAATLPKNAVSLEQPEEILEAPDTLGKEEASENLESLEEVEEPVLDPLNNANNPVPVNPVAPKEEVVEEELPEDVKANLFSAIGMMFGMIVKPGSTIIKNSKRYRSISKALVVTIWVSILSIILCMAARIVVGMFHVTYNTVTGQAAVSLNFVNMFNLDNYIPYLLVAFIMSFGAILVASLVYYASSFLNSKGVHMGTYFMVSCLAMVPVIVGVLVLYPILNVFSPYIAMFVFVFTLLYTLISFYIGMNEVLTFKSVDKRILYNVINLSLIFAVIVVIFLICFRLNILVPPEFYL